MAWNNSFRKALQDSKVPGHLWTGLIRWVEEGIEPGSFLRSVILNDLQAAALRADVASFSALPEIVRFLSEHAPEGAFFNPKARDNWPLYVKARQKQATDLMNEIIGGQHA